MKTLSILLILLSTNCFAYDYEIDVMTDMEQQNRQREIERRIETLEQQKRFDEADKQYENIYKGGNQ